MIPYSTCRQLYWQSSSQPFLCSGPTRCSVNSGSWLSRTAMTASQEKGSTRTAWMDYKYKSCRITPGRLPEGTGQAFWTYDTSCDIEADASSDGRRRRRSYHGRHHDRSRCTHGDRVFRCLWRMLMVVDLDGWPQALQQDNDVNQQELPISAVAMRLLTDCFPILFRAEDGSEIAVELKLKQIVVVLDAPKNAYRR